MKDHQIETSNVDAAHAVLPEAEIERRSGVMPIRQPPVVFDAVRLVSDSQVRLRAVVDRNDDHVQAHTAWLDAQDVLDELREDLVVLTEMLVALESASPHCRASKAAPSGFDSVAACLHDIRSVRDALAGFELATESPSAHSSFRSDTPLADYVRGVHAWLQLVVRIVGALDKDLSVGEPNWRRYRQHIERANNFHFLELEHDIRGNIRALGPEGVALAPAFESVLERARELDVRLASRFA